MKFLQFRKLFFKKVVENILFLKKVLLCILTYFGLSLLKRQLKAGNIIFFPNFMKSFRKGTFK